MEAEKHPVEKSMDQAVEAYKLKDVQQKVATLRAQGKQVTAKISADEYARVMAMPHEDRLAYAMKVMNQRAKVKLAQANRDKVLADQRRQRKARKAMKKKSRKR